MVKDGWHYIENRSYGLYTINDEVVKVARADIRDRMIPAKLYYAEYSSYPRPYTFSRWSVVTWTPKYNTVKSGLARGTYAIGLPQAMEKKRK